MNIEDVMKEMLAAELPTVAVPPKRMGIFDKKMALYLRTYCIQHVSGEYYRFHMKDIPGNILYTILGTIHCCDLTRRSNAYKRSKINDVLIDMGYEYMSPWITCHRNSTYTISIPLINTEDMIMLSNMLFPL